MPPPPPPTSLVVLPLLHSSLWFGGAPSPLVRHRRAHPRRHSDASTATRARWRGDSEAWPCFSAIAPSSPGPLPLPVPRWCPSGHEACDLANSASSPIGWPSRACSGATLSGGTLLPHALHHLLFHDSAPSAIGVMDLVDLASSLVDRPFSCACGSATLSNGIFAWI